MAEEEAGGGDDGVEVDVLLRGEGVEEVRPWLRGGTVVVVGEPKLALWTGEVEGEPRVRPGMEVEEAAAALCCDEEEGVAEEGHRGTEEEVVLASGAHSSQPRHLLSSR